MALMLLYAVGHNPRTMHGLATIFDLSLLEPRCGRLEVVRMEELDKALNEAIGWGSRQPQDATPVVAESAVRLSKRQREVLQLIARGKLRKEIASELGISQKTVDTYCMTLFKVLNVHNKVEVARVAIRLHVV